MDKSVSFHHRNIRQVAIEMYKVKHNLSPPFMKEIFEHTEGKYFTRSGDKFHRPNDITVYMGARSLKSFGPVVWNLMLPENLKSCLSLAEFKRLISLWVPSNCPCYICKDYVAELGYVDLFE